MTAAARGQLTGSAAEVYESFFVPALFAPWPPVVLDAVGLRHGEDLLDVGCGTGVLAREAARRLGDSGSVTGLDVNPGMLAVAGRAPERVRWVEGPAECLPFGDAEFDRVTSQFVLMFVPDPVLALREMARVTRRGKRVAVATWCAVGESPGYAAMVELLDEVLGRAAAEALLAPFVLGTADVVRGLLGQALGDVQVTRHRGEARFASLDQWLHTDIRGWTLAGSVDEDQYAELCARARTRLARFVGADGRVRFDAPALVGVGTPA